VDLMREVGFPDVAVIAFSNQPLGYIGLQYIFIGTRSLVPRDQARPNARAAAAPPPFTPADGEALLKQGRELADRGELVPAGIAARQALDLLPHSTEAMRLLADVTYRQQNWVEAGTLFQTLARHFPDELGIWQARLDCARGLGHEVHRKLLFQDAVRLHPEWASALARA
jgi:tetratricopeptide (TPR) repeat protein